jgi:hypothetical protein
MEMNILAFTKHFLFKETCRAHLNSASHFKEIKYFSPDGKTMPNGIAFERGNFFHECRLNSEKFIIDKEVHPVQYGLKEHRGGIIVLSTDIRAVQLDSNIKPIITTFWKRYNSSSKLHRMVNMFNKYNKTKFIGAYSVRHAFNGKYVGYNGEKYNEHSTTIEINGLSCRGLLILSEMIARALYQESVLIKDLNKMKLYYAASL